VGSSRRFDIQVKIRLMRFLIVYLITDESDNHAIKVEEEHDQMEAEFAERFLSDVSTTSLYFRISTKVHTFL